MGNRSSDRGKVVPRRRSQESDRPDLPHGRLGFLWALVTAGALVGGKFSTALWMTVLAILAAVQGARTWRQSHSGPRVVTQAVGAMVVSGAGLLGSAGIGAALGGVFILVLGDRAMLTAEAGRSQLDHTSAPVRPPSPWVANVALALLPGLVGAVVVAERVGGLSHPALLVGYMAVFDGARYLVGSGYARPWEGLVAGLAGVGALTVAVAAVAKPSLPGYYPWLLGLMAAVLIPPGALVGNRLIGQTAARAPAWRRLDSLFLLAPVWALLAPILLG
ncbi:MAG: hypothetical protein ACYCS7_12415 [Acidimicrobiales bacterium]